MTLFKLDFCNLAFIIIDAQFITGCEDRLKLKSQKSKIISIKIKKIPCKSHLIRNKRIMMILLEMKKSKKIVGENVILPKKLNNSIQMKMI